MEMNSIRNTFADVASGVVEEFSNEQNPDSNILDFQTENSNFRFHQHHTAAAGDNDGGNEVEFAGIATRVGEEFSNDQNPDSNLLNFGTENSNFQFHQHRTAAAAGDDDNNNGYSDFEFSLVFKETNWSPVSADEIFFNGKIKPSCNLNTIYGKEFSDSKPSKRLPLSKLFAAEEGESESYCAWTPDIATEISPGNCKKLKSIGSFKKWKLRDLICRSSGDGKDAFVFLRSSKKSETQDSRTKMLQEK